jgi:hypothetical protein
MTYDHKILDLKYHINGLMPKSVCDFFINFYEDNLDLTEIEMSYKFHDDKVKEDNFKCINLSENKIKDDKFLKPLELINKYMAIMVSNYELYIRKSICPTFQNHFMRRTSNVRILKYGVGEFIKDHSDTELNWGTHYVSNRGSCTINLNEGYEGGEFRIFNGKVKQSFKTGDAMLFPAEPIWIHGTEPITKGVRYCINCFFHP